MSTSHKEYSLGITLVMLVSMLAWLSVSFAVNGKIPLLGSLDGNRIEHQAGVYRIGVTTEPATIGRGENRLTITLRDSEGMNLPGAQVRVVLESAPADHAHADHQPAAFIEGRVIEIGGGRYQTTVDLPAEGDWPLLVEVKSSNGGHADLALTLSTGSGTISVANATPVGQTRYTCSMHPSVSMSEPGACPLCGMDLTPIQQIDPGVAHYTCPMHPSIKNAEAGQCPICGMDLTAVSHAEKAAGSIIVDQRRRQLIGLKTAPVTRGDLKRAIRLIGEVEYDPESITDIALPFDGKIGKLFVVDEGQEVKTGDPLFSVSSPILYQAERDYVRVRKLTDNAQDMDLTQAREHLQTLGLNEREIEELDKSLQARAYRTIHAPVSGVIAQHSLIAGQVFWLGDSLLHIAVASDMRIKAAAYESDAPFIQAGMASSIRLPYISDAVVEGTIDSISPVLNNHDRTAEVYVDALWTGRQLLARSYADVIVHIELKDKLLIPEQAVIHSGDSRVVFVDEGEGRLQPRRIKTGQRNRDVIQVLDGLAEGEIVVTSGNFLLASESKLKAGIDQW
jgi:Cu(I)/Ag(I) efflux system membrane fusion protein